MDNLIDFNDSQASARRYQEDPWTLLNHIPAAFPPGLLILPPEAWHERWGEAVHAGICHASDGIALDAKADPWFLRPLLRSLPILAVRFDAELAGRGYYQAYQIRQHLGWRHELRAVGQVTADMFFQLRSAGFDSACLDDARAIQPARPPLHTRPLLRALG
ncbi:uncharacterized protein (DUF934 family) [Pseudomonas citronellolis]|uniref:DUF934 domain-containing protein n=1 Tax=Pseudomonas citronellolis TaxID=53408 RepID=UPI00209E4FC0|nr:uncharacterized protein (DUF934 family) [Pseudomonas citronellolis]MCP1667855.1 uncharacterized protein (DUF934 family) [Pseudomonas citronellolis]MCP1699049.1 uncharacterized protein (DUF934 family) [Pseudomonas citronellolis]MCP1704962.1 uncharacterized protein (DUF934 family) [Pseudomonas citronellolis]MCP1799612.1 uncharacterized protein (DUF934 family) [Pseudomonas citronellolis]